jgi:NTP pyrophosphatase (non-canonical NTP hydrolase)
MEFDQIRTEVDRINRENGWHLIPRTKIDGLMLIISEAAEAFEWIRSGDGESDHLPGTPGRHEEIADIVIRCMDEANREGFDLERVILQKLEFNLTRGQHHGGKLL